MQTDVIWILKNKLLLLNLAITRFKNSTKVKSQFSSKHVSLSLMYFR